MTRRGRLARTAVLAVLLVLGLRALVLVTLSDPVVTGLDDGDLLSATAVRETDVQVDGATAASTRTRVRIDGAVVAQGPAQVDLRGLADGAHVLEVERKRGFGLGWGVTARHFTVDTVAPTMTLDTPREPVPPDAVVDVTGRAKGGDVLVVDGTERTRLGEDGAFTVSGPAALPRRVVVADAAGNTAATELAVGLNLPGHPGSTQGVRGVHLGFKGVADPAIREAVYGMVDDGLINTVQIDVKDESGRVGYATEVPLGVAADAALSPEDRFDLAQVTAELHERGARVVGRIVNFADPRLVEWAVGADRLDLVIQDTDGGPLGAYDGFANPASPEVRDYNVALAVEAGRAGVDDILLDYVRRPEGARDEQVYPGLDEQSTDGDVSEVLVAFLDELHTALAPLGVRLGASLFGSSVAFPEGVDQDVPRMVEHLDYVAPMLYPSHWAAGDFGLDDPNAAPYETIHASLPAWNEVVEGTDVTVVPWLQAFSLHGVTYGPQSVRAQIEAAADRGIDEFLLWNRDSTYQEVALGEPA